MEKNQEYRISSYGSKDNRYKRIKVLIIKIDNIKRERLLSRFMLNFRCFCILVFYTLKETCVHFS